MLWRSATDVAVGSTFSSFAVGSDSPVSADSSTRSSAWWISRRSAGTLSTPAHTEHVAPAQLLRGPVPRPAVAHHSGPRAHHRPQRVQAASARASWR